jgi:hypothetical protein
VYQLVSTFSFCRFVRLLALRAQVGVQEVGVAALVVGVVGDVLGHVPVEVLERRDVGGVAAVHAAELRVLLPQVGLEQLRRGQEPQDGGVAAREPAGVGERGGRSQRASGERRRAGGADAQQEPAPADDLVPVRLELLRRRCALSGVCRFHLPLPFVGMPAPGGTGHVRGWFRPV